MAEVADVMAVARAANAEAAVATAELASVEEGAGFALPLSDPAALPVPQRKVGHAKPTVIKKVKKAKVRTPVRSSTSSSVPPSSYVPPSSPLQMSAQAPVQSLTPMMPPLEQQAQSLNPLLPGGATLPPAVPIESKAPSSLSMITTSDLELGDRGSWLTVLAIAVVAEVALLWFAAALGVWRRKLALNTGHPLPHPIKAARRGLRKLRLRRG